MKLQTTILCVLVTGVLYAGHPGDNLFGTDQVITVELTFSQPGFWDSLVANYTTLTYMKADVTITDNTGTYNYNDIGIRLKGNSSYGHPGNKKSFKIDFNRYVDSLDYDKLEKLNFNNCFKDPTFMREKIMYDICRQDSINAPRANYANVYMNGTFWGFYTVVEQVDDDFLNTHFDESAYNLFKAGDAFGMGGPVIEGDLKYYGTDQASYDGMYTLENNTTENNWSDLIDLLDFINNTTDADFANQLSQHFNVEQLMKSMVMYNLFANLDSYLQSARNYYLYDKDSTGIWEWINWDCNEAFGSYGAAGIGGASMTELGIYYYALNRPLFERILTIDATKSTYEYYYCLLKNTYFTDAYINSVTASLYDLISDDVYADVNKMYTDADFDTNIESDITGGGGPGGGTIYGLKSFISERNTYLDAEIDCSQVGTTVQNIENNSIYVFPNPAVSVIEIYTGQNMNGALVNLVNISGQTVQTTNITGSYNQQIDISGLPQGIYFITLELNGKFWKEKFVKM